MFITEYSINYFLQIILFNIAKDLFHRNRVFSHLQRLIFMYIITSSLRVDQLLLNSIFDECFLDLRPIGRGRRQGDEGLEVGVYLV